MDEEKKLVGGSNQPSSSNSSQRLHHNDSDMSLDGGGGDDLGWWDCSLCTYKNSADKFKCEVCDLRRGTSTRKPRCNADTIVAQVVKQQEQIRQQTKAQKTPKRPSRPSRPSQSSSQPAQASQPSRQSQPSPAPSSSSDSFTTDGGGGGDDGDATTHSDSSDTENQISDSSSSSSTTASSLPAPEPTSTKPFDNNPFKITPLEVDGNLIKYSPPTSNGRTGLIIDKKRFTQHSVTVNDVTITFTEFATRQNRYVRKKKRVRDRSKPIGNGKTRVQPKSEP